MAFVCLAEAARKRESPVVNICYPIFSDNMGDNTGGNLGYNMGYIYYIYYIIIYI